MDTSNITTHLRYLTESSHLLALSAPEVSRFLMNKCNKLSLKYEKDLKIPQVPKSCNACGAIIILGWGGTISLESTNINQMGKKANSKKRHQKKAGENSKTLVYECKACHGKTRETLRNRPKIKFQSNVGKFSCANMSASTENQNIIGQLSTHGTQSLSSKRRRKSKKNTLEALLAERKDAKPKSVGFDLMDFMKKT
ncbi:BgTH12-06447 [Blumeria graminis f. sp. triticale]|uniref:Bgt-2431 n=3 Tax=Blumeria graminis TaxID=34373 RepID=A0A061HDI1_BLUGR|nr:hypothetical protein BGT96224_2431 [Blumeria graminis f. sp. tritici 96224]CAD6500740.1 BgTH12-06447 [Blumeria graminis f. sp. triticale]VCU41019.1 Bgt-2431 [Blumeria graminis f. sp. tritici]